MSGWCIALLACLSPQGVPQWEPESVVIDDEVQFQTWEGFGAASVYFEKLPDNLPGSSPGVVRDLTYLQTGANRLRLRIPADLETSNDDGSTSTMNFGSGGFAFGHWALAVEKAYVEAKARGIDYVWASCGSPPAWMKQNAPSGGTLINGGELNPAYYDEFAEFLAAYVIGLGDKTITGFADDIEIDAISILNEPDYLTTQHESTPTSAVEYAKLVRIVGMKFAALNLDTVILGPECGTVANSTTWLQAIADNAQSPPALDYLDEVISHQYGGPTNSGPVQWAALGSLASSLELRFGQTEIANLGNTNDGILAGLGDANGTGVSDWILSATNGSDCSHWSYFCYWWNVSAPSNPSSTGEGLLRLDTTAGTYAVPKRFRVFQHYAAHIQPGAVRIQGNGPRDIGVSAWLRPVGARKEYAVVLSNKTSTNYLLDLELPAAPSGPVTTYLTTSSLDHSPGVATPSSSTFHVQVPAESIKTLIVPMGIEGDTGIEVQMTPGVLTGGTFDLALRYHAPSSSPPTVRVVLARQDPDGAIYFHNGGTSTWSTTFGWHQFNVTLTDSTQVVFNDQAATFFAEGRSRIFAALYDSSGLPLGDPCWMDVIADH